MPIGKLYKTDFSDKPDRPSRGQDFEENGKPDGDGNGKGPNNPRNPQNMSSRGAGVMIVDFPCQAARFRSTFCRMPPFL